MQTACRITAVALCYPLLQKKIIGRRELTWIKVIVEGNEYFMSIIFKRTSSTPLKLQISMILVDGEMRFPAKMLYCVVSFVNYRA